MHTQISLAHTQISLAHTKWYINLYPRNRALQRLPTHGKWQSLTQKPSKRLSVSPRSAQKKTSISKSTIDRKPHSAISQFVTESCQDTNKSEDKGVTVPLCEGLVPLPAEKAGEERGKL